MKLTSLIILVFMCLACSDKKTEVVWNTSFYDLGTQSSPRATDLNGDQIKDIIVGAGKDENADTQQGVIAVDGHTGTVLWEVATTGHMYGSPVFYDITQDNIDDIIIGGRHKNLMAIDGQSGDIIWQYEYHYEDEPVLQYARFNFYNGTLIPDQNGNGFKEYLVVNGGNWDALPNTETDRFPGVLLVIDTKSGEILASDVMPDNKESYMSPVAFTSNHSEQIQIIVGTGGETIGGHLYLTDLRALYNRELSTAKILRSETDHGFISPPAVLDLNADGNLDIVSISHNSHITAINGLDHTTLWESSFPQMESSNGLSIGQFTTDAIPDVFTIVNKGIWPSYTSSLQIMIDGKSGELLFQDSIGCFNLTTAVVTDLNRDGIDEVVMSYNDYDCELEFEEGFDSPELMTNTIIAIDFTTGSIIPIDQSGGFRSIFASPWLGDLDGDGYIDLVYCQNYNPRNIYRYAGMRIKRVSTSIKMTKDVLWGEYMGNEGKSIFQ